MTAEMTALFTVFSVTDQKASSSWYEVLFNRPADQVIGDELMWMISESAWLVSRQEPGRAGGGEVTMEVRGLDRILTRVDAVQSDRDPVETYSNGVRHVVIRDPDGNRIVLAAPPEA